MNEKEFAEWADTLPDLERIQVYTEFNRRRDQMIEAEYPTAATYTDRLDEIRGGLKNSWEKISNGLNAIHSLSIGRVELVHDGPFGNYTMAGKEPMYRFLACYVGDGATNWVCTNHTLVGSMDRYKFPSMGSPVSNPFSGEHLQAIFKKFEDHWEKEHAGQ